jgi:methionyl-tRNA formyltransferase
MGSYLFCLATRKGHRVLQELVKLRPDRSLYVCTFREKNVSESYDDAIKDLAVDANIPVVRWRDFRERPIEFLEQHEIRSIVCIGWKYLVPQTALEHLSGEVIVAHDSLLPKLRGFAPLPTALISGESETGVTFMRAGSGAGECTGVDGGDILWQGRIPIGENDSIAELIDKVSDLYAAGTSLYLCGELTESTRQDESLATYSIWRDLTDYRIDWNESAARIERTIRALGPPYLGAQTTLDDHLVRLDKAEVLPHLEFAIRQPGKIWSLDSEGRPQVVCGQGMLKILEARIGDDNLIPMASLRKRFR